MPHLKISEVVLVLVYWNIINNDYQQDSRELCTYVHNKLFGQLLHYITYKIFISKSLNSYFSYIEVWFTDQNSKPLDIKDKINLMLVFN